MNHTRLDTEGNPIPPVERKLLGRETGPWRMENVASYGNERSVGFGCSLANANNSEQRHRRPLLAVGSPPRIPNSRHLTGRFRPKEKKNGRRYARYLRPEIWTRLSSPEGDQLIDVVGERCAVHARHAVHEVQLVQVRLSRANVDRVVLFAKVAAPQSDRPVAFR